MPGMYSVAYMLTRAGDTSIAAALIVTGGLQATYYDSVATSGFQRQPVMARTVQQVSEGTQGGTIERGGPPRAQSVPSAAYTGAARCV